MLNMIKNELDRETRIFERNEVLLEELPAGYIERIRDKNGRYREFVTMLDAGKNKKRQLLGGDLKEKSMTVADYELRKAIRHSRKPLQNNISLLKKLYRNFVIYDPAQFRHPAKDNRILLAPGQVVDLADQKRDLHRNQFHAEDCKYLTKRGEKVRSKSELMIADLLFEKGIDYLSDFGLNTGDRVLYPDFQVKRADGRLVIWEHFGLISNPAYVENSYYKISLYGRAGFTPGENLIITTESNDKPITREVILNVIEVFDLV